MSIGSAGPGRPGAAAGAPNGLGAELRRLKDEISGLLDLPCVIGEPGQDPPERYLRIETVRVAASPYRADLSVARVNAEVLVQAYGPDHLSAADTLARCMLELMAQGSWDLIAGQPDVAWWAASGRAPSAAFMISIPVTLPIQRQPAPPVRQPLEVRGSNLRHVSGRVLAADGTPLSGARVQVHPDGARTVTGYDGRWALTVPNVLVRLDVFAKRTHTSYDLAPDAERAEPTAASRTQSIDITLADVGASPAPGAPATT
jgi:hypothetical protein